MEQVFVKTTGGGPYRITKLNSLFIPVSLRGPLVNFDWVGISQDEVIRYISREFDKIEVRTFEDWKEGFAWCLDEPYLPV